MFRRVLITTFPFFVGVSLAWGCAEGADEQPDECEHIEEHAEEACAGYGTACHDACHENDPADADTLGDCLHDAADCAAARDCLAGTSIDGCIPDDA